MLTSSAAKRNSIFLAIFGALLCAFSPCVAGWNTRAPATGSGRQVLHMRQVKLYDAQGFAQPILSRAFLLPANWEAAGGVQWNAQNIPNQPAFYESFSAVSPDQLASFEMLPDYTWTWHTDPQLRALALQAGGTMAPPLDAVGVVREYIIPNYRQGATILSVTPRPDLVQAVRQQMGQGLAQLDANGCRMHFDFVEARLGYTKAGIRFEEAVVVQLRRADFLYDGMQMFTASNLFLFKAPAAQWKEYELIYATAMRSMRQNPGWLKAIHRFNQNIARIYQEGARRRQQIMSEMYADVAENNQKSWEYRQESLDRVAREFSESIREVETYHDPATGFDVELPNIYEYAYSNGQGDYVITNDAHYDPSRDLFNSNWQTLEVAR